MTKDHSNTMSFDRPTFRRFKIAYDRARTSGLDQFSFDGHDFLVAYARYLIEYLEGRGL